MTRVAAITLQQRPEKLVLSLRQEIDFFKEYSELMGTAIQQVGQLLEQAGLAVSSGPLVCFHNVELAALDVEIGFQIPQAVSVAGKLQLRRLPVETVAVTIDRGPYEAQDSTLQELLAWLPENNYQACGGIWYHYLNDESQPPAEQLTEMSIPVKAVD